MARIRLPGSGAKRAGSTKAARARVPHKAPKGGSKERARLRVQLPAQPAPTVTRRPGSVSNSAPPPATATPGTVVLRLPDGHELTIRQDEDVRTLQRESMYWAYVVRSRRRWAAGSDLATSSPIQRLLPNLADLQAIADAGIVEVDIPYTKESVGWEFRVLPWEYLLSAATKLMRGERALTVIRRLNAAERSRPERDPLQNVVIVESAPLGLDRYYDVKGEGELMVDSLGLRSDQVGIILNPFETELRDELARRDPTLVHVAGIDTHQAIELLDIRGLTDREATMGDTRKPEGVPNDGYTLRATAPGLPNFVDAWRLAGILNAGTRRPEIVVFNFYNSASRIAALAVASGARVAIGYQDVVEDDLAAAFCATFYRALRAGATVLDSFRQTLVLLRNQGRQMKGAGIVLWTADSLLSAAAVKPRRTVGAASAALRPASEVSPAERIRVEPKPLEQINYSLLHNRRSLFKSLDIYRRDVAGPIDNIEVSATLFVGHDSFPFQLNLALKPDEPSVSIADRIVVPLTSAIIRTQSESLQSSLFLKVCCANQVVYADTTRVQLSPVDEWTDTDDNRWWLPSFVLPRDPAVAKIIDSSQRYLMAIADDPNAGFDGYQSVDESADTPEGKYGAVDLQVRAIWSALLYEYRLHYINPPPSYSRSHQRLRTPSDIVSGGRGTCIDLALLLCACLEYVDIYPVIFLLEGHAFPGYWRSDRLAGDFRGLRGVPLADGPDPWTMGATERSTIHIEDSYATKNFLEARSLVNNGRVVPLETVWLTTQGPFADAVEEALKNLRRAQDFNSMMDVTLARKNQVTPLPILWRPE